MHYRRLLRRKEVNFTVIRTTPETLRLSSAIRASGREGLRRASVTYSTQRRQPQADKNGKGRLFRTTKHIINERTVQIFTPWTDEIKKRFMIFHVVFGINKVFLIDRLITERTEISSYPRITATVFRSELPDAIVRNFLPSNVQ